MRALLAGGAVTVTGRLDVLLGGPPTGRPGVVVEVKGGRWYDGMRADGHLYALLVALRDGVVPAAVVTVVADGTTHVEAIRPALVRHAAERLELALRAAAPLAAGEPPEARPGSHCAHCPARLGCTPASPGTPPSPPPPPPPQRLRPPPLPASTPRPAPAPATSRDPPHAAAPASHLGHAGPTPRPRPPRRRPPSSPDPTAPRPRRSRSPRGAAPVSCRPLLRAGRHPVAPPVPPCSEGCPRAVTLQPPTSTAKVGRRCPRRHAAFRVGPNCARRRRQASPTAAAIRNKAEQTRMAPRHRGFAGPGRAALRPVATYGTRRNARRASLRATRGDRPGIRPGAAAGGQRE